MVFTAKSTVLARTARSSSSSSGVVCLHRYFAHAAFRTSRALQLVLGIGGCLAFQGDPLWWGVIHERHHKHCDVDGDPHSSARQGVLYAVVGWMANPCNYRLQPADYATLDAAVCTAEMHAQHYAGYAAMVYCVLLPMRGAHVLLFHPRAT